APRRVVRGAETPDESGPVRLVERLDGLEQRYRAVLGVRPEQVHRVQAEALQASLQAGADRVGGQSRRRLRPSVRDGGLVSDLRGDPDLRGGTRPRPQPPAEDLLAGAADAARIRPEGVAVRRVDPYASGLDEGVEDLEGASLVGPGAEEHGAEDDVGREVGGVVSDGFGRPGGSVVLRRAGPVWCVHDTGPWCLERTPGQDLGRRPGPAGRSGGPMKRFMDPLGWLPQKSRTPGCRTAPSPERQER